MAASMTLNYWGGARNTNPCIWVTIFLVAIVSINLFGARGYGEAEFIYSIVKVIAALGFIIFALVVDVGGGPTAHYFGATTWDDLGSFAEPSLVGLAGAGGGKSPIGTSHRNQVKSSGVLCW
ncbi:uncharacterized protein Z518_04984 [Rhinocladiella mackenziei CBS 650.93]|uniref:Rhinocladiella mackenziei CBS 650.93 unplaced genomic scaffold supercont1.3, whole genome shotgun sequence n=1 Tax=Rhinocladiella mackenziei CBS 650.93 TaxID=1442369 RepID=A0A0D2H974_9EURO|nr:uncharacterized protein Z518_04984 [Rhinocladiella mackenziei CBS 650.93]KIX07008.1 hypothetical protein Z518_04984 [Rhinocladiella mackenziei CBS 650.93]